ncbi:MAG: hypothetical protein NVSMB6_30040 [Burkholderiaceae bacterium]
MLTSQEKTAGADEASLFHDGVAGRRVSHANVHIDTDVRDEIPDDKTSASWMHTAS